MRISSRRYQYCTWYCTSTCECSSPYGIHAVLQVANKTGLAICVGPSSSQLASRPMGPSANMSSLTKARPLLFVPYMSFLISQQRPPLPNLDDFETGSPGT